MMRRAHCRLRRGIATPTALTLLAFVAVLLAALGSWIGIEARRTRAAADAAQLRQLLHAGALAAADESLGVGRVDVPLPPRLADHSARLTIDIAHPAPDARTAVVEASITAHRARQTVHFARTGERWSITGATLDPS